MSELSVWDQVSPARLLNLQPVAPAAQPGPGVGRSAGPGLTAKTETQPPWHPDNPLFIFGLLAAITFGLVATSTSVRVGPFKASASAGNT